MGFSITDMLNKDTSMAAAPVKDHTIERISYSKLVPSEDNFYSMQEIEELKTAIELAGRVLNNLVVTPLEDGKYKILSGHRRHRAVGMLLDEGKTEYEFLPCSVEQIDDTDRAVRRTRCCSSPPTPSARKPHGTSSKKSAVCATCSDRLRQSEDLNGRDTRSGRTQS